MKPRWFDLIIIGAGPAGCAAAITAAQAGLRVVLIERATFPRAAAGESLHPGVEPLLERLGVSQAVLAANFLRFSGQNVRWGRRQGFESFGNDGGRAWLGFQAWRPSFDSLLLARARDLFVTVVQPCPAIKPRVEQGRLVGIDTPLSTFRARFTIDATGRQRAVARHLAGLPVFHGPRRIVYYGYAAGDCPALDLAPRIVADTHGWTWSAAVKPHLYHWCRLAMRGRPAQTDLRPDDLQCLAAVGSQRAADLTWRLARTPARDDLFVVGDAAAVLDPVSSHGVLRALMSGMMASHLIIGILGQRLTQQAAIGHYTNWLTDWFWHDVNRLESMYRELSSSADTALAPAESRNS
jgi:flavin-dependent dehydrogenase